MEGTRGAHRAWKRAEMRRRGGRRRGPGGGARTGSETGRSKGPPDVWAARIDAGCACEVGRWVRVGQKSPAASNSGESRIYQSWVSGAIPRKLGSILRSGGSESFWTSRRGGCGGLQDLGGGGVAGLQWRREVCAAERGGGGVLGLRLGFDGGASA